MPINVNALGVFGVINKPKGDEIFLFNPSASAKGLKRVVSGGTWSLTSKFSRTDIERDNNNGTREVFLRSLGKAFGMDADASLQQILDDLNAQLGSKILKPEDFGLANGQVTSGKPLTERRITAIVDKVCELAKIEAGDDEEQRQLIDNFRLAGRSVDDIVQTNGKMNASVRDAWVYHVHFEATDSVNVCDIRNLSEAQHRSVRELAKPLTDGSFVGVFTKTNRGEIVETMKSQVGKLQTVLDDLARPLRNIRDKKMVQLANRLKRLSDDLPAGHFVSKVHQEVLDELRSEKTSGGRYSEVADLIDLTLSGLEHANRYLANRNEPQIGQRDFLIGLGGGLDDSSLSLDSSVSSL